MTWTMKLEHAPFGLNRPSETMIGYADFTPDKRFDLKTLARDAAKFKNFSRNIPRRIAVEMRF
jgi:hypothetical protein